MKMLTEKMLTLLDDSENPLFFTTDNYKLMILGFPPQGTWTGSQPLSDERWVGALFGFIPALVNSSLSLQIKTLTLPGVISIKKTRSKIYSVENIYGSAEEDR